MRHPTNMIALWTKLPLVALNAVCVYRMSKAPAKAASPELLPASKSERVYKGFLKVVLFLPVSNKLWGEKCSNKRLNDMTLAVGIPPGVTHGVTHNLRALLPRGGNFAGNHCMRQLQDG